MTITIDALEIVAAGALELLVVRTKVSGFALDGTKIGAPVVPRVGYWQVFVDDAYAGLSVSGAITLPNDSLPSIAAGVHEIKVSLRYGDHSAVDGVAPDTRTVTLPKALHYSAEPTTSITIVRPAAGSALSGPTDIVVLVGGLRLDGTRIGTPAAAGIGHWHLFVDGKYAGLSISNVITIPNDAVPRIAPGPHKIKVNLNNNNHRQIDGPQTEIEISVIATLELAYP